MTEERKAGRRLAARSPLVLASLAIVVLGAVGVAGYYAYRTYDYVQHDNDFCMSCHLMAEPFEAFARSAHQGLGCKACHRPNLIQRSQMGLTQVLDNPTEISVHAAVPNEVCSECHIEGDPEKWRLIANTAGHRVHLESEDSVLQGLQCVECHSTSIHEFSPVDRTCSQSGCHDESQIRLGAMGSLTIHCQACHTFVAPVVDDPTLFASPEQAALLPTYDECLSCHVMRTLVELPDPDPHQGGCALCHNPHEQTEPSEAAGSCSTAGCHDDLEESTAYHRGLAEETLADCMACHQAHDFSLQGGDCTSCHEGVEAPATVRTASYDFAHTDHGEMDCASCHATGETHGAASVVAVADCRACHHTPPESASCELCHAAGDAPADVFSTTGPMVLAVGVNDPARAFRFPHADHSSLDCASCHTEGIDMGVAADLDCASCHEDHHTPVSDCAACHVAAPVSAHPPAEAHLTCSGSGCHTEVPFETVPRTREFCLGCHQDLLDHEPAQTCSECHQLPAPRRQGGSP